MIARNRAASKVRSGPEAGIPGSTPVQRQNFGEFAGRVGAGAIEGSGEFYLRPPRKLGLPHIAYPLQSREFTLGFCPFS